MSTMPEYMAADEKQLRAFAALEVIPWASTTPQLILNPFSAAALVRLIDWHREQPAIRAEDK